MKSQKWETYDDYLKSPEWAKIRKMALDRAKHHCQVCNSVHDLHAHHRVYDSPWGEESTDDITILCHSCHMLFHRNAHDIRAVNKLKKKIVNLKKEIERLAQKPKAIKRRCVSPPAPEPDIKVYQQAALAAMERMRRRA